MKKFGINLKYKNLIIKAVVCGEVDENDLENTKADFDYDFLLDSQELRFAIEKSYVGKEKIELDRDREWYWIHKGGVPVNDLANDYDSVEKVDKQIDRYRKFLKLGTSK